MHALWLKAKDTLKGDFRRFNVYEMTVMMNERETEQRMIGYDTRLVKGAEPGQKRMVNLSRSQIADLIQNGTVNSFRAHSKRSRIR